MQTKFEPTAAPGPESPTQLSADSWRRILRRTVREVKDDHLTDWAAALTYYAVLSIFPGLIVLVALVGIFGRYPQTTNSLLKIVDQLGPHSAVETFRQPITSVVRNKGGAGALLGIGLVAALWAASGYVGAFIRATNVIYEVKEGRPFWKLRPLQIAITIVMVVGAALVAMAIVATGPLARAIGDAVGLGPTALTIWDVAKWPVLAIIVITMFAVLYYCAPNVQMPRFRWLTPGGLLALVLWLVASALFAVYAANFHSYNATYGSLGGVVVFLVWLWITNLAVLLGAEFNAEIERRREIEAGEPGAATQIHLPVRSPAPDDPPPA